MLACSAVPYFSPAGISINPSISTIHIFRIDFSFYSTINLKLNDYLGNIVAYSQGIWPEMKD